MCTESRLHFSGTLHWMRSTLVIKLVRKAKGFLRYIREPDTSHEYGIAEV